MLSSAINAGYWVRTLVSRDTASDAEIAQLEDMLARLVQDHRDAATAFEDGLRQANIRQHGEDAKLAAQPSSRRVRGVFGGDPRDGAGVLLDGVEQGWMHPDLGVQAASVAVRALLRHARLGDLDVDGTTAWGGAVALALRYNLDGVDAILTWWRDAGDPDLEEPRPPVDALLASPPTWDGAWQATFRALAAVVPWLTGDQVETVVGWLWAVPEYDRARRVRAGATVSGDGLDGFDLGVPLMADLVEVVPLEVVGTFLERLGAAAGPRWGEGRDRLLGAIAQRVTHAAQRGREVRSLLRQVVTLQVGGWFRDRGSDAAVELASVVGVGIEPEDVQDRDLLRRWAKPEERRERWAWVADHCFPNEADQLAAETVQGLLTSRGTAYSDLDGWAVLAHLVPRVSLDRQREMLALAVEVAEGAASVPDRDPIDQTGDRVPRLAVAAALAALVHASSNHDASVLARALSTWRGLVGPQQATLQVMARDRFPDAWLDDSLGAIVDAALRGRAITSGAARAPFLQPPSRDQVRRIALLRSAPFAFDGHPFAWARLPAVASIVRHADAQVQANAVRWVGGLAKAGGADHPWDRWLEAFETFTDDRRVKVQAALASVVADAAADLPEPVRLRLDRAREVLALDPRVAVQCALGGR